MSQRRPLVCVLGAAALVSACGSTTTVTHTVTHDVVRSTTVTTPSPPPATSSTSSPTSTAGPASGTAPMCLTADFTLVSLGGSGATGHALIAVGLRNHSGRACSTGGYPGVLMLDAAGRGLPTVPDHTTDDFFGATPLRELTVAPGGLVSFRLGVSDVSPSGSDSGCVTVHGLQVIAPDNTASADVSRAFQACSATVSVSPLQAGAAARH